MFARSSAQVVLDVPASQRPHAPRVAYAVPTFGWTSSTSAGLSGQFCQDGNGLRVYLEAPGYSSGEGEVLAVVVPGRVKYSPAGGTEGPRHP